MDTIEENGTETHKECCRYMTYCHLNKNEILFEQGNFSSLFISFTIFFIHFKNYFFLKKANVVNMASV